MIVDLPAPSKHLRSTRLTPLFLVILSVLSVGCSDDSLDLQRTYPANLSLGVDAPIQGQAQLALVDRWRIQVLRPGGNVLAENSGVIDPGQNTLTIRLAVTLEAPCEVLTMRMELLAGEEVLFRSEVPREVCVGVENGIENLELSWVGSTLDLSPGVLAFELEEGQPPLSQEITVSNTGGGILAWGAVADREWIQLSPAAGALGPGESRAVQVTVSQPGSTDGEYQGAVTFLAETTLGSPGVVPVTVAYSRLPRIGLSTGELSFVADEALDPEPQSFTVTNEGGGTLDWSALSDAEWLVMSPSSGSLGPGESAQVEAVVSLASLPAGPHEATIQVAAPGAPESPRAVGVKLTINPRPVIGLDITFRSFRTAEGENPAPRTVTLSNDGGGTLNWSVVAGSTPWLTVSPESGSLGPGGSQSLTLAPDVTGLEPGTYQTVLEIADPWALNSPRTLTVRVEVLGPGPPTISNLNVNLVTLNDPTCPYDAQEQQGSRFRVSFQYSDPDGNLPEIVEGSFNGSPVELESGFPDFPTTTAYTTANVDGDRNSGSADLSICIVFDFHDGAEIWLRLWDLAENRSNQLYEFVPRPAGAVVP